ncbi:MAG: 3-hydroxybutyryl-CoA dehydrogenase [Chitinophagaceae bacterium]|nr:3-hydroxybutyryl-CoA dehydrogenase [Chitinophagaceae bacterium]
MEKIQVGIIGCGTMGAGIAQVAAQMGHGVIVVDTQQSFLEKAKQNLAATFNKLVEKGKLTSEESVAIQDRMLWTTDKSLLKPCGFVLEAIVENLEIKQQLFHELEHIVSDACILASNTSSLSITSIAAACAKPERVMGVHFFNPAPIMELVELIPALQTQDAITNQTQELIDSWKKKTVKVKDTPGFIVNRIARPFYSEAIRIYEEGIASMETIDHAMKAYGGFRMGPFELMDMIGHDVNYTVTETVWKSFYFDPRYTPSFVQKRLVEAKWFGRKSGRGFYNYAADAVKHDPDTNHILGKQIADRVIVMLINEAAQALYLNIATEQDIETAMTKGVNYPKGLLAWAQEIGYSSCAQQLDALYNRYHEDRYRCSVWLRDKKEN